MLPRCPKLANLTSGARYLLEDDKSLGGDNRDSYARALRRTVRLASEHEAFRTKRAAIYLKLENESQRALVTQKRVSQEIGSSRIYSGWYSKRKKMLERSHSQVTNVISKPWLGANIEL